MIELTTGIMFLMSSMYGAGSNSVNAVNLQPLTATTTKNTAAAIDSMDRAALEKYLREHFADTPILVEIARCESTFRQFDKNGEVIRGKVNSADVGIMQINEKYHLETAKKLGLDIHTVDGNIEYAKYLYSKYGAEPWSASSPCWGNAVAIK